MTNAKQVDLTRENEYSSKDDNMTDKPQEAVETNKKTYYILGIDGDLSSASTLKSTGNADFRVLVEKEALGKEGKYTNEIPKYIRHMNKFGMEWEPMSDVGHMRYGPEGALIMELARDYANQVVREVGIPVYNVLGTNMFRLSEKPVKQHAELFGDRLYQLESDNEKFILRYAACHQQFAMIKDWTISYKNLPFGAFEIADSYRYEQQGELVLCFRLRRMNMPDMHVFTKDMEEAKDVLLRIHKKIYSVMNELGRDYVSLYNTTSLEFIKNESGFLKDLLEVEKKPALIAVYPPGKDYYWVLNIEYHIIDQQGRPREIGTVQIDVGNAKRFGMKYNNSENKEEYPVILHTAIIGTLERFIYTLFDTALIDGENRATLPLWISPTQARICPIKDSNIAKANAVADILEAKGIRVDVDDRSQTLQRKISDAERHWIPYLVVIGDREEKSDQLPIRIRKTGTTEKVSLDELALKIKKDVGNKPFRPLSYPRNLSNRPIFNQR